ncbi:hypothetical protein HZ326_12801, partial [Fusarium oxysporum f. sp. albedinis]
DTPRPDSKQQTSKSVPNQVSATINAEHRSSLNFSPLPLQIQYRSIGTTLKAVSPPPFFVLPVAVRSW